MAVRKISSKVKPDYDYSDVLKTKALPLFLVIVSAHSNGTFISFLPPSTVLVRSVKFVKKFSVSN